MEPSRRLRGSSKTVQGEDGESKSRRLARPPHRRIATVYDAVAGRISTRQTPLHSYGGGKVPASQGVKNMSRTNVIMAPEEVLFRRKRISNAWPDSDEVYMEHENLPNGGRGVLPDSDMLKAIHTYAGHFYESLADDGPAGNIDEGSMDGTALLAFGILLEEAGRHALGDNGDLVFTEGLEEGGPDGPEDAVNFFDQGTRRRQRCKTDSPAGQRFDS